VEGRSLLVPAVIVWRLPPSGLPRTPARFPLNFYSPFIHQRSPAYRRRFLQTGT